MNRRFVKPYNDELKVKPLVKPKIKRVTLTSPVLARASIVQRKIQKVKAANKAMINKE